jgi:hypothetical protein
MHSVFAHQAQPAESFLPKFFSPHDLLPTGCFRFSHLFLTHLPSITIGCAMCIQSAKKQSQQIVNSLSDAIKSMTQPETLLFLFH